MLHLLNQTVLLDTASLDKQVKIRDFLIADGYEVYVRMMTHTPMQPVASRFIDKHGERESEGIYRIYVRRKLCAEIMNKLREHNII